MGTPTTFLVDADGDPIDWSLGYDPPAGQFMARLEKSVKGIDTFKVLSDRYAKNPKDAEAVFKLALKYSVLYEDKAKEKWKEGVALDPEGKAGTFVTEFEKAHVTYTEYGELLLARDAAFAARPPNAEPLNAFIRKYPQSELLYSAYQSLASAMSSAPKDEAVKFFEEYVRKYPADRSALRAYLGYLIRTGGYKERGEELAARLNSMIRFESFLAGYPQVIAEFYLAHGDKAMAEQVFGPSTVQSKTRIFARDLVRYADFWAGRNENRESALAALESALRILPNENSIATMAAGAYMKLGMEDRALTLIGPDYAKKFWDDPDYLWSYVNFWAGQGKHLDEALTAGQRIIQLAPDHASGWDVLSQVYAKQKNYAEAIKAGEKAVSLAEDDMRSYYQGKLSRIKALAGSEKK